jgi:acetyltransferase
MIHDLLIGLGVTVQPMVKLDGYELIRLLEIARDEKVARVVGEILPDNREMQRVCEKLGFRLEQSIDEPTVRAIIDLSD